MQAVIEAPTARVVEQAVTEQVVNRYLRQTLGEAYRAGKGRAMPNGDWRFLVLFHVPGLKYPSTTGIVQVDGQSGRVLPLTAEQCQEVQERALIAQAEAQKRLPVVGGYISRIFAQRRANLYLSNNVGFFFTPINGTLMPAEKPVWQFPIQFRLPQSGDLGVLGTVCVDAQTGEVLPLTSQQITEIQRRANALARGKTQPPAA